MSKVCVSNAHKCLNEAVFGILSIDMEIGKHLVKLGNLVVKTRFGSYVNIVLFRMTFIFLSFIYPQPDMQYPA